MNRRPLGEMLCEIMESVRPDAESSPGLRIPKVEVDLPIEAALIRGSEGPELLADLPRWRWRSVFDREPGRLKAVLVEERVP